MRALTERSGPGRSSSASWIRTSTTELQRLAGYQLPHGGWLRQTLPEGDRPVIPESIPAHQPSMRRYRSAPCETRMTRHP